MTKYIVLYNYTLFIIIWLVVFNPFKKYESSQPIIPLVSFCMVEKTIHYILDPPNYFSLESLWNSNGSTENHRCQQVLVDISVRASEIRHSWLGNPLKMKALMGKWRGNHLYLWNWLTKFIPGPTKQRHGNNYRIERAKLWKEQQTHTPKIWAKHIWSSDQIGLKKQCQITIFTWAAQ